MALEILLVALTLMVRWGLEPVEAGSVLKEAAEAHAQELRHNKTCLNCPFCMICTGCHFEHGKGFHCKGCEKCYGCTHCHQPPFQQTVVSNDRP